MSDSHQQLVEKSEKEMIQLVKDIKRIGDGKSVKFGALFDDEEVQDFYEALIGTLKGARKKGYIDFPGHLLLKGQHDNVEIIIVENGKSLNLADTLPPPAPISPTHELAKSALAAASTKPQRSFLGVASTVLASSPKNSSPSTPVSKKKCPTCANVSREMILSTSDIDNAIASMPLWCRTTCNGIPVIRLSFRAKNFSAAMSLLNEIGEIAEAEGHHPDLHLTNYRDVGVLLYTHSVKGVTPIDIAVAKLIEQVL